VKKRWKEMSETSSDRIAEAYVEMAKRVKYRPQAPGDGFGEVSLSEEELADEDRLLNESYAFADRFIREEETRAFWIGCSDFRTKRAFVYTIEAARMLATGSIGITRALKLLSMALKDARQADVPVW
jgi:hypothetical protein